MTTGGVNSRLKDFAKKYDIREDVMHAHAFRHFFAIQSLNNGVDMSLLKIYWDMAVLILRKYIPSCHQVNRGNALMMLLHGNY